MIFQRNNTVQKTKKVRKRSKKARKTTFWKTLKHNGVLFTPLYQPQNLTISIKGNKIRLTSQQEEMAWAWAAKQNTHYVNDEVFASNFLSDFRKILPSEYSKVKIEDIDFSDIIQFQEKKKELKSQPEVKKKLAAERKKQREYLKEKFGFAEINGCKTEIANYAVEPPGIFMGRGKHPLRGRWKRRIYPEDITLNLSRDVNLPALPENQKWGKRVHDHQSMWLASWFDKLTGKIKYVWPHDNSTIRQQRDKIKYDKAQKLLPKLGRIRKHIMNGMVSKDDKERKVASVCYLIDKLCMRVGDEKDEDEADTVGASTLRVEHVKVTPDTIQFNFLGKDSIPWSKSLSEKGENSVLFRKNVESFMNGKKSEETIFTGVRSSDVNRFLGESMKGLTAKVFRTFHATSITNKYLLQHIDRKEDPDFQKIFHARMANLEAAITCNHKRTPPKNWEQSIEKKRNNLKRINANLPKNKKAKKRYAERVLKAKLALKLASYTKDYNLNTSQRNYIDPRIYKSWSDRVNMDWQKIYPKTLQNKFSWVAESKS